jgi:hypothetical protein
MPQKNFRSYKITLTAGQDYEFGVNGNMYAITSATGAFTIVFDESQRIEDAEKGTGGQFDEMYKRVVLNSPTTQTVIIVLGFGKYTDARATLSATVNTTIEPSDTINNPGDVTATTVAALAIASNVNRKEVELAVPSDQLFGVRVGNAAVTNASGSLIEPGTSKTFAVEAALYVIREAAATSNVTVTVLELERP